MSLSPGTRLGAFQLVDLIGRGGMGEVYWATDTKLKRQVAIKILPPDLITDRDRLARFQREAEVLASLNHPHIAAIYGLEESEGMTALVMELVEGDDLSQRIAKGAIPIDEALPIARQIAEALEVAHEQGIVHRDLKPANIKLRPDGTAKVLDFGLAKAMEPAGAAAVNASQLPTITTPAMTQAGMILGTAAYMSPEQARGKTVDRRADIWAFGVVLFEMLTGTRAFPGEDLTDTLAAVVKLDPKWDALAADVPTRVRHVLRACLQKDPKQRMDSAQGVRLALDGAFETAPQVMPVAPSGRLVWMAPWSVSVVMAVVAATALLWPRGSTPSPPVTRFVVQMPPTHDLYTGGGAVPAISADGRTLFYVGISANGGRNVYRRQLDQLDAVAVPGVEGSIQHLFLSPDGRGLGFMVTGRAVRRIDLAGGPVATVSDTLQGNNGGTWLADNTIVFSGESPGVRRRLYRVSAAGGLPTALTNPTGSPGVIHVYPQAAPGGAVVAFTIWSGSLASARVAVRSLETGQEKVLLEGTSPWILSTGHLVYAREGSLWAVPFDADRLQTTGEARRVVENVQVNGGGLALFAVSANGTLVYVPGSSGNQRTLVWVDRQGREAPLAAPPRGYSSARVSPDGTHVALDSDYASGKDVWIWDEARAVLARFTSGGAVDGAPEWTPNGRRIVFSSTRDGSAGLFSQDADGTAVPERLVAGTSGQVPYSFTPDGRRLIFQGQEASAQASLAVLTLGDSRRVAPLMSAGAGQFNAALSADGAWIAYQSNESGQSEIYVRPFPEVNDGRWQVSSGGGTQPAWARSGGELFFVGPDGDLMSVAVRTRPVFSASEAKPILPARYYLTAAGRRRYDVSPDGQRFLMLKESASQHVVVVQNWSEELKRLAPTK